MASDIKRVLDVNREQRGISIHVESEDFDQPLAWVEHHDIWLFDNGPKSFTSKDKRHHCVENLPGRGIKCGLTESDCMQLAETLIIQLSPYNHQVSLGLIDLELFTTIAWSTFSFNLITNILEFQQILFNICIILTFSWSFVRVSPALSLILLEVFRKRPTTVSSVRSMLVTSWFC